MSGTKRLSREETRERTRELIVGSAAKRFAESGFEGASVDEIAEAAGFSRGAFYSNFSGKEEIFLELLKRHLEKDIRDIERVLIESIDIEDVTHRIAARYRELGENPDWCLLLSEFQLFVSRHNSKGGEFMAAYNDYQRRLTAIVRKIFDRFKIKTTLTASEMTSAILGLSHGLALERAAGGKKLSIEAAGQAIRALITGAIK